jgi:serine/threonine protein kinase
VLRELGGGATSRVFEARHVASGREVALKTLRREQAADERIYSRFVREVRAIEQIDNPHVVRVIQVGEDGVGPYYAMELIAGSTLRALLAEHRAGMWGRRAVGIALQVCSALAAAHDVGVIHRDLKPGNVLLTRHNGFEDFVRLIDFGVAKLNPFVDTISVASTVPGTMVGSPTYMAPEQIRGRPVDPRTDVYGLGVMLYEMLSGRVPFVGEVLQEVLAGHVCRPPRPLRELDHLAEPVEPALEAVVLRCLAKSPDDRHQDMRQLSGALRPFAA